MKICSLIILCFFLFVSITAFGQQYHQDSIKGALIKEVVVNAPVFVYSIDKWPGAISVLDSLSLQSGNDYDFSRQINVLPGVYMQQGTSNTSRITIRGIGSRTPYNSNRIKAYWGNVPLTDGDGITSIEDMGFDDIKNIQVIKGPASALYGAGLGGVLLLESNVDAKADTRIQFASQAGDFSTFLNKVNFTNNSSGNNVLYISAQDLRTKGWRENSNYVRENVTLRGKFYAGKNMVNLLYHYRYLKGEIPSSLDSADFFTHPEKAADSWKEIRGYEKSEKHIFAVDINSPIKSNLLNKFALYGQINNLDELRPFNRLNDSRYAIGARESMVWLRGTTKKTIGFEYRWEHSAQKFSSVDKEDYGALIFRNNINYLDFNLFGLFDFWLNKRLNLQASLNLNKTSYNADEYKRIDYEMIFSPKLSLLYQWSWRSVVYGSVGHGFSAPSYEELSGSDGYLNDKIKPEEGWGTEFGYRYTSGKNKLSIDASFYYMFVYNMLVTKRESEEVFYGTNAGRTDHHGLEFALKFPLFVINDNDGIDLQLNFFKSINKFIEFVDDGNDYNGNTLPGIPAYNLSVDVISKFKGFKINLHTSAVGEMYMNDINSKKYKGHYRIDSKLSKKLGIKNWNGEIFMGFTNMANTHYASMILVNAPSFGSSKPRYYYPGEPFSMYGGVSLVIN